MFQWSMSHRTPIGRPWIRATQTAPFGYVLKPFREQELLVAIEMAVFRHSMERRLRQSERKFVATLASIGDGVIATDLHGRVTFMNPVAEALTAWPFADARDRPVDSVFRVTRGIGGKLVNPVRESLAERRIVRFGSTDLSLISRTNETIPIDDCAAPIVDDEGRLTGSVVAFRDVRERREHERQRNYLASIVECSEDAIIGATLDGRITTWNSGAERLYGYTAAEAVGQDYESLLQGQNADALAQGLRAAGQGGRVSHFETVQVRKNGDAVETSMTLSTLPDRDGTVTDVAMIVRDISQQKRFEARLQYLADHDPLTGLLNRRRFGEEVERQLAQASRYAAGGGAVLVLDLDEFKQINDTLGHRAGDEVIRAVAVALSDRMRETDVISRMGGDEFVVLLVQVTAAEARLVASDLIDALQHPLVVDVRRSASPRASESRCSTMATRPRRKNSLVMPTSRCTRPRAHETRSSWTTRPRGGGSPARETSVDRAHTDRAAVRRADASLSADPGSVHGHDLAVGSARANGR